MATEGNTGFTLEITTDPDTRQTYFGDRARQGGWIGPHLSPSQLLQLGDLLNQPRSTLNQVQALMNSFRTDTGEPVGTFVGSNSIETLAQGLHTLATILDGYAAVAGENWPYTHAHSPGLYAPAYIDKLRAVHDQFGTRIQGGQYLLAGALGGLSAHEMRSIVGFVDPDAHLTVADKGTQIHRARAAEGQGYSVEQVDLLNKVPGNNDVILTNVLLPSLRGKTPPELFTRLNAFFRNCYNALNKNGALVMVEEVSPDLVKLYEMLLEVQGFSVSVARAKTFKGRRESEQFFAGSDRPYREEDTELATDVFTITAVKQ